MKDFGSRIVPAPMTCSPQLRPTILDVVCGLNEEVEWHWTMTDRGPFVSGYSIVRRIGAVDASCASAASRAAPTRKKNSRKIVLSARRGRGQR